MFSLAPGFLQTDVNTLSSTFLLPKNLKVFLLCSSDKACSRREEYIQSPERIPGRKRSCCVGSMGVYGGSCCHQYYWLKHLQLVRFLELYERTKQHLISNPKSFVTSPWHYSIHDMPLTRPSAQLLQGVVLLRRLLWVDSPNTGVDSCRGGNNQLSCSCQSEQPHVELCIAVFLH